MADLIPDPPQDACANCATPLGSDFCAACGQKRIAGRLRTRELLRDVWDKVVDVENGFLHTCWFSVVRPYQVTVDWLSGRRRPYTPPARFLVVAMTIEFVVQAWLMRRWPLDAMTQQSLKMMTDVMDKMHLGGADATATLQRFQWLTTMMMMPCMAFGTWLMFRPWKRTFAEHLAGAAYTYGGWALIATPLMAFETAVGLRSGGGIYPILTAGMPLWIGWAVTRSFPGGPRADRIGRTIGAGVVALTAVCIPMCVVITGIALLMTMLQNSR